VEKCGEAGQITDDIIRRMRFCMLGTEGYKHTLRICNIYCFSTGKVVALLSLNVKLYVNSLAC